METKTVTIRQKGVITLPVDVRRAYNLDEGDVFTLNRRHFIDDPTAAARSGLRIATPGDALSWVRACVSKS